MFRATWPITKTVRYLIKAEQRIHFCAHKICSQAFWGRDALLAKPWLHCSEKYICFPHGQTVSRHPTETELPVDQVPMVLSGSFPMYYGIKPISCPLKSRTRFFKNTKNAQCTI